MAQQIRTERKASGKTSARRFVRLKLFVLLTLCALPIIGAGALAINGVWLPLAIYLVMSVLAVFLYWRDKRQARADGWRTPEKVLHAVELLGGWPGALIAQQLFRHKTRKVSFQLVFWLIVLLHQAYWVDRLLLGGNYLARHFY
ncbi:DUF1294 domain-containing protein [Pseudomonas syringae]|uniref:Membrane protein n=1 Tax=Pseudomonas syringae TaxID=317 RepID=A0A085VNF0_PSESX|nr:DUF1294 domain-containing protein [Pseudomonas syringae]KFE56963.1 membrane protein [Pseudomonas syringae]